MALTTLMAQAALRLPPPPPMFFVSHSNCTLQEGQARLLLPWVGKPAQSSDLVLMPWDQSFRRDTQARGR